MGLNEGVNARTANKTCGLHAIGVSALALRSTKIEAWYLPTSAGRKESERELGDGSK